MSKKPISSILIRLIVEFDDANGKPNGIYRESKISMITEQDMNDAYNDALRGFIGAYEAVKKEREAV